MSILSLYNKKCNIQKRAKTYDANTKQLIETWSNMLVGIPCCINTLAGGEKFNSNRKVVNATDKLYLINNSGITEGEHRVSLEGITYDILLIADASGRGHHKELWLQKVV